MPLDAFYFDGNTSRRHPVRLAAGEGCLLIEGGSTSLSIPAENIRASEPQGRAPRTLRIQNSGAFCEVAQSTELDALLAALGRRDSFTVRLQKHWRWAIGSLACVGAVLFAAYVWGLPWGAKIIAPHVPISVMHSVSEEALSRADKFLLMPTALPLAQQQKLTDGFRALAANNPSLADYGGNITLIFRAAPGIGPNAFAFPGGQVLLLDELVSLNENDEETLAVLAHELGHLAKRHGIRQLIQTSVVAAFSAAWLGDISGAAAAVSASLLSSSYSRDMEREADEYAAYLLKSQGKSPALLADALEKLEAFYREKQNQSKDDKTDKYLDWLSSHPGTSERAQRLRDE